jgi:hypothetical protein
MAGSGDRDGGRAPRQRAGIGAGGRAHLAKRPLTATLPRPHAGFGNGGKVVPALAQAARATCHLGKGAAILRWCFLTKIFRGGPFCHFIGAGGLMCQKFKNINICSITYNMKIYFRMILTIFILYCKR